MISEIKEAILLLILREKPQGIIARSLYAPIPIVIHETGSACIRPVLWAIEIEEISQSIS
jgi:hypothetical protein